MFFIKKKKKVCIADIFFKFNFYFVKIKLFNVLFFTWHVFLIDIKTLI